jgi:hypothetical protein
VTRDGRTIEYIEVEPRDIALANELADEVLGRSLDELPPQTRRLLETLDREVTRECTRRAVARCDFHFFQRDVREWSGWSDFQVKTHLQKLVAMEYVLIHRGGRGQSFVYELLYDGKGKSGRSFLPGLINVTATEKREHQKGEWEHSNEGQEDAGSGQGASRVVPGSDTKNSIKPALEASSLRTRTYKLKKTHGSDHGKASSYPQNPSQSLLELLKKKRDRRRNLAR